MRKNKIKEDTESRRMALPRGWIVTEWGNIVSITHGRRQNDIIARDGKYPIYGSGGIIGYSNSFLCKAGSTIIGRKGTIDNPILTTENFWNIDTAFGITPTQAIIDKLLYYFCVHFDFKVLDRSTTIPSLTQHNLYDIPMPLPPLPEQYSIVEKIETLFSKLDKGVEALNEIKQQLKIYRQAVLKRAFEDKDFKKIKISDTADVFGGGAFKSGDFQDSGKFQVVRIGNIRPGILRLNERPIFKNELEEYDKRFQLLIGDVIISLTGTRKKRDYGYTTIVEKENLLLNQRVAAIRFNEDYYPKFFMYYSWTNVFKDDFFANETGNVGQGNVGMKAITETYIPYCAVQEQKTLVSAIESRFSICDQLERTVDESLAKAYALRQSILKRAFEGKLVPQDPNDEPAEKMLERIKAERETAIKQMHLLRRNKKYAKG